MDSISFYDGFYNIQDILRQLKNVKKSGGGWSARCPAHDDKHNSLSVSTGEDSKPLFHCHAGCSFENIISSLNITLNSGKRIAATYDYFDEEGKLLFQSVRYEPKEFRQRRPDGKGDWIWNLESVQRVPYRLPELIKSSPGATVFVVEGEKDADRLAKLGLLATTNPAGAGKWRDDYSQHLRDKHVIIIPDNDEPGRSHAKQVARSVYSVAKSVRVLELPDVPLKGDVSNWLNSGGTIGKLQALAEACPLWMLENPPLLESASSVHQLLVPYSAFKDFQYPIGEEIAFELRRREIGMVASVTNVGKSTLIRNALLMLATGGELTPFVKRANPRRVGLLDFETSGSRLQQDLARMTEDWSPTERRLLDENFFLLCEGMVKDDPLQMSQHLSVIENEAKELGLDLIVVDTSAAAFEINNENDNSEVSRKVLKPLIKLARDLDCAVVIVHHIGKFKSEDGSVSEKVHRPRGASAFSAFAASVFVLTGDASDPDTVTVSCAKRKSGQSYDVMMKLNRDSRWLIAMGAPVRQPSNYERVLEFVRGSSDPAKLKEIVAAMAPYMSRDTVKRQLKEGLNRGDIVSVGYGLYAAKGAIGAELFNTNLLHLSPEEDYAF